MVNGLKKFYEFPSCFEEATWISNYVKMHPGTGVIARGFLRRLILNNLGLSQNADRVQKLIKAYCASKDLKLLLALFCERSDCTKIIDALKTIIYKKKVTNWDSNDALVGITKSSESLTINDMINRDLDILHKSTDENQSFKNWIDQIDYQKLIDFFQDNPILQLPGKEIIISDCNKGSKIDPIEHAIFTRSVRNLKGEKLRPHSAWYLQDYNIAPNVSRCPSKLSISMIELLMRDMKAFYQKYILSLKEERNGSDKGELFHKGLEEEFLSYQSAESFFWRAQFKAIKDHVQLNGMTGSAKFGDIEIEGKADRIDFVSEDEVIIIDYKTGSTPKKSDIIKGLNPKLPLLGYIAENGGFDGRKLKVVGLQYWMLKGYGEKPFEIIDIPTDSLGEVCEIVQDKIGQLLKDYY